MTTLITGGTGFIGSNLARMLIDQGERPVLLDVAPVQGMLSDMRSGFDYVRGSVTSLPELINCMRQYGVHRVFHLGGMLSLPSEANPWAAFEANIVGTYHILEASRITQVEQVVYGSTIATYSEDIQTHVIDDRTLQRPSSMYGVTKVSGELLGRFYAKKFGLDFRGVRLPSVVGPGAKTAHMSIYNAWAIEEPLKGHPYELRCEPETRCAVIYFKDAANAILFLSQAGRSRISTMIYNVAGVVPQFSANDLVSAVRSRIPGAQLTFHPDPEIAALLREIGRLNIDDSRAQSEWGWKPAYSLEDMVDDFIKEFNENRSWYLS